MLKTFNVTGTCFKEDHYMADVSEKWNATYKMVEQGAYFVINRPRQYGKTTTLYYLAQRLTESGNYLVFNMSFEGIGDLAFEKEEAFSAQFVRLLAKSVRRYDEGMSENLKSISYTINSLDSLGDFITDLVTKTTKKIVVLIDEVDKSSNNQLFINFLALLRNKYLDRKDEPTFHSVVLAGVHDVKSLKLKIRPDAEHKYNSPWNIATTFKVNMNLLPHEIRPMLEEYSQAEGVAMDTELIADRLFFLTSGYPFLVSQLCKIIAEELLPNKPNKEWTLEDVNKAYHFLLQEGSIANFDTLIKNLEGYPELYNLVFSIIFDGAKMDYSLDDPLINLGTLHGIFSGSPDGLLVIQNRIYRERIANYMISKWRTSSKQANQRVDTDAFDYVSQYHLPNKALDMQKVLENFQTFMRKEYSSKDRDFLEREGRMIFLAFMRPILNGAGYDFKEPQVSEERRVDVVITYHQHLYVAELKIWHGEDAHQKGLVQLADYLDYLGLDTGFLLIFDHNKKKTWKKDWVEVNGKKVFWVKV